MIEKKINELVRYGLRAGLLGPEDVIYTTNRLLELFGLEGPGEEAAGKEEENGQEGAGHVREEALEDILGPMLDYACEKGLLSENSTVYRDLFDTRIMAVLMPRPGEVIRRFWELYRIGPQAATDYYYKLSQDSD